MGPAAAVALGFVAGVLSGAFGIGGGVLLVPALSLAFGLGGLEAVGTSLPVMIPTALAGAYSYLRAGQIRVSDGLRMGLAGAVTAPLGALGADRVGGTFVLVALALVVLYIAVDVAIQVWRPPARRHLEAAEPTSEGIPLGLTLGIGATAGAVAGFLGVGGGFLMVPLLSRYARVPVKRAIGTSLTAIAILAVPGPLSHVALGNADLLLAVVLALGMVPGALVGARITLGARDRVVQTAFAILLWLIGIVLLLRQAGIA